MREYRMRLDEYGISGDRYRELLYMCRQYEEMRKALQKNPEDERASARIAAIEKAARLADEGVWRYILKNVTSGVTYEHMGVPCGRRQFFTARRRFFWELDKRI